jgi:hypothetical protein
LVKNDKKKNAAYAAKPKKKKFFEATSALPCTAGA